MARPRLDAPNFKLVRRGSRFYVRWWQNGQWRRISTGTKDQPEARRFLVQFAAGHASPEPPPAPTTGAILDGYLADRKGNVVAYSTLEAACTAIRRHLGDLDPGSLTRKRGQLYAKQRRAEGHQVGPAGSKRRKATSDGTIIREIVTLRAALKWAQREGWISQAPYIPAPSAPAPKDRWLTREEYNRLLSHAAVPHIRLFIILALHTAARTGALLALTWSAVDLNRRVITLGTGTGNKGRAIVPISDALLSELRLAQEAATCDAVIEHGGYAVASIKTGFNATCRRAGLAGVTPHTLRHTAATWMAAAGVPMAQIARYLGHRSEAVTEKVYSHHAPDYLRNAANSLAGPLAPKTCGKDA